MAAVLDLTTAFGCMWMGVSRSRESIGNGRASPNGVFTRSRRNCRLGVVKATAGQTAAIGASAAYAKEMERLSAKESLLLAFKDSGGLDALLTGKTTDVQRIDVNERITSLERLNPTPRPTTSPFLEGRWNFEWFGAGTPGLFAARILLERFPSPVAKLLGLDVLIKDSYAKATASLQLFNSIETKFIITTKLAVEGPLRMSEEYTEGVIERPSIREEALPEQIKGAYEQALGALQQLPLPIRDFMSDGLKVPLGGTFQRMFMVSYLDEEILIIRNTAGVPDVLSRLEADSDSASLDSTPEYES
ncbi:probable plastid-lipid-associated protein 13, chloroplastic [Nymphaea colorata]|nr:probable plastid-lipid-associated protein 13, chloroplastic [Nymphaea colorata]